MSPTFAVKPRAAGAGHAADGESDRLRAAAASPPLPHEDDPAALWKAQRKLKHARADFGKRHGAAAAASAAKPKFKQHGHHHHHGHQGIPLQELRRERDLWLANQQQLQAAGGRSIPDRRRTPSTGSAREALSKSVPSSAASSWPPASGVAALDDENDDPNATRWDRSSVPLSSSAPKESSSKREARPMTLFESASFFNESGNLLSHDTFAELGASPDMAKRKPKRRVGRHKASDAKAPPKRDGAALNQEELVLELMAQLLPHVDVGKELNLRLLARHPSAPASSGDVFHFEHDETADTPPSPPRSKSKNAPLEVDLLKFQAALTSMVFGADDSAASDSALQSLDGAELVEHVLSDAWVARTLLATVTLDALAQYDRFAVLLALFRAMPHRRSVVLDAVVATALAIFDHQGADATRGRFADVECVSVKGVVALLAAVLNALQRECEAPDADIDAHAVGAQCDQLGHALQLLIRSAPGKPRRADDSYQLDKFSEDSMSLEATTYGALGEVVTQLAAFSPPHGDALLRWLLRKWPARNVQLQLFFVRFTGALLAQFARCGLRLPHDVIAAAFTRVATSITSPHFLIANEACGLVGDLPLMDVYLSPDPALRERVASALHVNARAHWNTRIRELSDEHFDMLLDLA